MRSRAAPPPSSRSRAPATWVIALGPIRAMTSAAFMASPRSPCDRSAESSEYASVHHGRLIALWPTTRYRTVAAIPYVLILRAAWGVEPPSAGSRVALDADDLASQRNALLGNAPWAMLRGQVQLNFSVGEDPCLY